jgi:two-component system NarL family sensor kinase
MESPAGSLTEFELRQGTGMDAGIADGGIALRQALSDAIDQGRRADCMARIQSDAVQLALDLLVRESDIDGFFRVFIKTLVDECESRACGVWLLEDDGARCEPWMAYADGRFHGRTGEDWDALTLPRQVMAAHLMSRRDGWSQTIEYSGGDARLPAAVRDFNGGSGIESVLVAPLVLGPRNLGWIALASGRAIECETIWRRAVLDATARQATLALHQSRLAEQSRLEARRQAALEERNRIARDIHDTLTQGFAAILMQLQAARRSAATLPPAVASAIDVAVDLARTHMIEARRSVGALRPQAAGDETLPAALQRMTALARRTTEIPITLELDELPPLGGVERDIIGIAQEALGNAVRHARARRITVRASAVRAIGFRLSVADDGRGIARENRGLGFGMTSMHERADRIGASLTIVTAPRAGTEVVLAWEPPSFSIPVTADDPG